MLVLEMNGFGNSFIGCHRRLSRISRSSRTLVPYKAMEFNPKCKVNIVHDEPESSQHKTYRERILPSRRQYMCNHSTAGDFEYFFGPTTLFLDETEKNGSR